jgi:hypothetical protein
MKKGPDIVSGPNMISEAHVSDRFGYLQSATCREAEEEIEEILDGDTAVGSAGA